MQRFFIRTASLLAAIAVVLGALGAHALKPKLNPDQFHSYETAVGYQMYHSLALLALSLLINVLDPKFLKYAGYLFISGIIFFSGSIYLLSTRAITGIENLSFLGPITPIGGLLMITGWVFVFMSAFRKS